MEDQGKRMGRRREEKQQEEKKKVEEGRAEEEEEHKILRFMSAKWPNVKQLRVP